MLYLLFILIGIVLCWSFSKFFKKTEANQLFNCHAFCEAAAQKGLLCTLFFYFCALCAVAVLFAGWLIYAPVKQINESSKKLFIKTKIQDAQQYNL